MKKEKITKPVRKIGKSHTSLTGLIASNKDDSLISFESSLERDFIQVTNFNASVASFVEQPVKIEYKDTDNKPRYYTPDFLLYYKEDFEQKPLLVEIKYRENLKRNWTELKPKFKAALEYCDKMNWKFKILTEVEIRTDFLFNANFLTSYENTPNICLEKFTLLLNEIEKKEVTTPTELINNISNDNQVKGEFLFVLWHMIANFYVATDLTKKLNMNSTIWSY